jgi:hypothetical protein
MKAPLRILKDERGGITFIEVLVTFIMVTAAVIATAHAMYVGSRALRVDMHKQQVLQLVEQEMEYWIARIYLGNPGLDPTWAELAGSPGRPYRPNIYLDKGTDRQAVVNLFYDPIIKRFDPNLVGPGGEAEIEYWVVTVWGEWAEFNGEEFTRSNGKAIKFTTYVARP